MTSPPSSSGGKSAKIPQTRIVQKGACHNQQLVGIARAVVHAPSLLLADEPTGNLHSTQAREIMELFRELNKAGTTIVQVTHSEENARYGSRILELRDGWLTRDTAPTAPVAEVKA